MPRNREEIEKAGRAAEQWLDSLDPAVLGTPEADASDLRAIAQATTLVGTAYAAQAKAVRLARVHGRSWGAIAQMLGTSRQNAHKLFGESNGEKVPEEQDDEHEPGTVGWLRAILADAPDEMRVVLSSDQEGNSYSPLDAVTDAYYVPGGDAEPNNTYPRFGPNDDTTGYGPEDMAPEGAEAVVLFWPTD